MHQTGCVHLGQGGTTGEEKISRYHLPKTEASFCEGKGDVEACRCQADTRSVKNHQGLLGERIYSVFNQPQAKEMASFQLNENQITKGR